MRDLTRVESEYVVSFLLFLGQKLLQRREKRTVQSCGSCDDCCAL